MEGQALPCACMYVSLCPQSMPGALAMQTLYAVHEFKRCALQSNSTAQHSTAEQQVGLDVFMSTALQLLKHTALVIFPTSQTHSITDALVQCMCLQNNGGMRLLLIDNIAAFYWLDKACRPLPTSANSAM